MITDVCMCEYTDHGHCGILREKPAHCRGRGLPNACLDNDATLEYLARVAVSHADAGADIVAPSDMMDGRVGAMRAALDENGFECTAILSYAAKYASGLLRAVPQPPRTPRRRRATARATRWTRPTCAKRCARWSWTSTEGADMVMVKPALPYLDVIRAVRDQLQPAAGRLQRKRRVQHAEGRGRQRVGWTSAAAALEMLTAIKRAGAELIITYWAKDAVRWLAEDAERSTPARLSAVSLCLPVRPVTT